MLVSSDPISVVSKIFVYTSRTHHGINKKIVSYFFEKRSIVLQRTVTSHSSSRSRQITNEVGGREIGEKKDQDALLTSHGSTKRVADWILSASMRTGEQSEQGL